MPTLPGTASASPTPTSSAETVVIAATGPSLTVEDLDACRGRAFVIVINTAWEFAPWADVLYAADFGWWKTNLNARIFAGQKFACHNLNSAQYGATVLRGLGYLGWSDDPDALYEGGHSGYQAIQLAGTRFRAKRILLLGYDAKLSPDGRKNCYDNRKSKPFSRWLDTYATLASAAQVRGIEIVNCSRDTALTAFPRSTLARGLCDLSRSALRA